MTSVPERTDDAEQSDQDDPILSRLTPEHAGQLADLLAMLVEAHIADDLAARQAEGER